MTNQLLIYTDLDGSLLDHYSYSHAAADPLLAELQRAQIPVIPVSSKTRAELLPLRAELANPHPFIVENGAAVIIPEGYFADKPEGVESEQGFWVKRFSRPRSYWLSLIASLEAEFGDEFRQFAKLSRQQLIELTGLSATSAEQAAARDYSEPIQWLGSEPRRLIFIEQLHRLGAHTLQGGRFLQVSDACDKGRALLWLSDLFAHYDHRPTLTLAIGDSGNDVAMLEVADYALLIRSPVHPPPRLSRTDNTLLSDAFGPQGWQQLVCRVLKQLQRPTGPCYG